MDPTHKGDPISVDSQTSSQKEVVVPVYTEEVEITRRKVATASVKVATVTHARQRVIEEELAQERLEIERVPVGRYVDTVPPVQQHGDLTILPVIEEVVVVERKLLLREEVHIRRVRTTEHHVETVQLREQTVVITRVPAGERESPAAQSITPSIGSKS